MSFAERNPHVFRILMSQGEVEKVIRAISMQALADERKRQYKKGKIEGLFWKHLNNDLTSIGEVGFTFYVINWWLDNKDKASRDEVIRTLVNVRRFGVEIPKNGKPDFLTQKQQDIGLPSSLAVMTEVKGAPKRKRGG